MAKKSTVTSIETELREVTGLKPGAKEKRQAFLKKLAAKVNDMSDADKDVTYNGLTGPAQDWVNACNAAQKKDQDFPDFDWQDPVDVKAEEVDPEPDPETALAEDAGEESEPEMPTKKTAKKAVVKKAAAPKEAKKPVVKAAKAPAKPKAVKKASNGKETSPRLNEKWQVVFKALAKAGEKGISLKDLLPIYKKAGFPEIYRNQMRRAGYFDYAARGVFKLTKAGLSALEKSQKSG